MDICAENMIDKINIICYAYSIVRKMKNLKKITSHTL